MSLPPTAPGEAGDATVAALRLVETLQAALRRADRAAIVDTARKLVGLRAPLGEQWLSLAMIAAHNGEVSLARAARDLFVESAGGDPGAAARSIDLLAQIGAWDEVLALLRGLPPDLPSPAGHAYVRGTAALYLGEDDEARHYLERAMGLQPQITAPLLALSLLVDFAREPELAERIVAGERSVEGAAPDQRANYSFALGKVHADRGDHARAFAAYAHGAGLMKALVTYDRERDRRGAEEAVSGYDSARIAALAGAQGEPTGRGIFVMGLPRSGTTLVEQILTSHSAVGDGAEIYRLGLLAKEVGGPSWAAVRGYVDGGRAPEAARLWRHWLDERFPAPGRVVDKTLDTSRQLGVAAALLPEAPLVWLVRDPLDCAWSCFRSRFAGDAAWSYDLADMAFHFRLEDALLAQWRAILGERLLVVPYEELASDPAPSIRRILAHCRLPEERQCFAPHENRRAVTTSSTMQVRRPINRQGIGSAEPYREFLRPFVEAYSG